jgi:hypothetical protein
VWEQIREDGVHVVTAERWRLANDQQPTFYLQRKDVTKITPYVIWQWKTPKKLAVRQTQTLPCQLPAIATDRRCGGKMRGAEACVVCVVCQRASHLKEKGNSCFKANDLTGAEKKYAEAIAVLQVHHTQHTHRAIAYRRAV